MPTRCSYRMTLLAFLVLVVAVAPARVRAQNDILVTTQMVGPVTNDLLSFIDRARVTLIVPGPDPVGEVVLRLRIVGDNGIEIRTPDDFDPGGTFPAIISPGLPLMLTGGDLSVYFDAANLLFSGISQAEYYDNGLPPGAYQVCFQALCPAWLCGSDLIYSAGPPAGCSNTVSIETLEPPHLISPPCDETVNAQMLQSVVFSWTPPPGADLMTTTYVLTIVEMIDPDVAPQDAVEGGTTPSFFEQEVTGLSFFYGPTQALFEPGQRYAWRVTAQNLELNTAFANGGHSEVCSFVYGQPPVTFIPIEVAQPGGGTVTSKPVFPLAPWSSVKGKIRYKFKQPASGGSGSVSQGGATTGTVKAFDPNAIPYAKDNVSPSDSKPLSGIRVNLVVKYRLLDGHIGSLASANESEVVLSKSQLKKLGYDMAKLESMFPDIDQVLASATTVGDGSFSFNYIQTMDTGLFAEKVQGYIGNKNQPQSTIMNEVKAGKVTRTLRVMVDSPYYCSPDEDIVIQPWGNTDLGTLVSYVKGYKYRVTVEATSFAKNQAAAGKMPGVSVRLLRRYGKAAEIPKDEGDPKVHKSIKIDGMTFLVVDEAETNAEGQALFKRMVAPNDLDDVYWWRAETLKAKGDFNYKPIVGWSSNPLPQVRARNIVFNSDLVLDPILDGKSTMSPDKPRVFGRVMDKANNVPVAGATVVLESKYKKLGGGGLTPNPNLTFPWQFRASGPQGYFAFDNLDVQEDAGGGLVGPTRSLHAQKSGYYPWSTVLGIMARGKQEVKQINLEPEGLVIGSVVDSETKVAVPADVYFHSGINVSTTWFLGAQAFLLKAPSGKGQKMTITPHDVDYAPETFTVDVPKLKTGITNLGAFKVTRKRHRLAVKVLRVPAPGGKVIPTALLPLSGATVKILDMVETTDKNGIAAFVFDNASNNFTARITPPPDADFVGRDRDILNKPTTYRNTYAANLLPAVRISGTVTVGDSIPVEGARVFLNTGSGAVPVETFSGTNGAYTLKGVPLTPASITLYAAKSSGQTTYVGDQKTVQVPTKQPVNLNLTVYGAMDITRVLGFPVEITALTETAGGVQIDGAFVKLPGNASFAPADPAVTLPFYGVELEPGAKKNDKGVPYAVPKSSPVETTVPKLALELFGAFDVELVPGKGTITVEDDGGGSGVIRGGAHLLETSFAFSSNDLSLSGKRLTAPGTTNKTVTALRAEAKVIPAEVFGLADAGKDGLTFKLYGFDSQTSAGEAYVNGDTIAARTVLHADVGKGTPIPVTIAAGWVRAHSTKIDPIGSGGTVPLTLEKWKIDATGWKLDAGTNGVLFESASVQTGAVTVPVKGMHVLPNDLKMDNVELQNLSLAGVVPLNIKTELSSFGYDAKVGKDLAGHWKLSLIPQGSAPAATIAGLPGMKSGATLAIETISLLSSGEQILAFPPTATPVTFYDVFAFKPGTIASYDDFFQLSGTVDLAIPRLSSDYQAILTFSKPASVIEMKLMPLPLQFDAPGKVKFLAIQTEGAQTLDPSGFHATGTIKDSEGILLKTRLHRTVTDAWVEVDPLDQILPIGKSKTYLSAVKGEMRVVAAKNDWDKFTFSGVMNGVKGMEGDTRKTFTIHGSITADNEKVSVKNIPSDFGNISITYDYAHARMIGTLEFAHAIGVVKISGMANMIVDAGGWYFLAGGNAEIPGFGNLKSGMLIGDYDTMPAEVATKLMEFAYDKHVPPSFSSGISGFFFTGRKNIPQLSVPDVGFDLGVVSAHLGGETGLDARVWMGFDGPGTEFGIGAMAFVRAYFIMSSIMCTKLHGEAAAELGTKGIINLNGQFDLHGCGSLTVFGEIEQCVPTPSLDGIDCELCTGISVSKSLKVTFSMGTGGVDAGIGLGTCSGNEAGLSSGW